MADTTVQREIAQWLCNEELPKRFGQTFRRKTAPLKTGGGHSFAAVSDDGKVVGTVITSGAVTSAGKLGVGKLSKVRADVFFLMLSKADLTFVCATDPGMYALLCRERHEHGRWPTQVDILHAPLPEELGSRLARAQRSASVEVSGG